MKKKIILLNPPGSRRFKTIRDFYCSFSSKAGYYWPPQDLLSLSGILRNAYDIEVLDAVRQNLDADSCYHKIMDIPAAALIFATGIVSFENDLRLIEKIKSNTDITVIGISSIFRFNGTDIMRRYPFLDALLTDFTDTSILDYLQGAYDTCSSAQARRGVSFYAGGSAPSGAIGSAEARLYAEARRGVSFYAGGNLIYRYQGNIHATGKTGQSDFSLGRPLYECFIDKHSRIPIFGDHPFSILVASFGCKFNCTFCVAGTFGIKYRHVPEVIADVRYLRSLGITRIFFVDPLFIGNTARTLELCAGMKDLKIDWISNTHASALCDENLLQRMREAGCQAVMVGVESGNDRILQRYHKGTNSGQIKKAFSLCRKFNIKTVAYFIIGLPGEDTESIRKTIEFAKDIECDYASFGYATPDIGTELAKESVLKKWVTQSQLDKGLDSSGAPVLETEGLSKKDARKLLRYAYRKFYLRPRYIVKTFSDTRTLGHMKIVLRGGYHLLKKNIL